MCALASLFRRLTDTNVHETGSVIIRKARHKVSVDILTYFTVYRMCGSTYEAFGRVAAEEGFTGLARDGVEVVAECAVSTHAAHLLVSYGLALFAAADRHVVDDTSWTIGVHQAVETAGRRRRRRRL